MNNEVPRGTHSARPSVQSDAIQTGPDGRRPVVSESRLVGRSMLSSLYLVVCWCAWLSLVAQVWKSSGASSESREPRHGAEASLAIGHRVLGSAKTDSSGRTGRENLPAERRHLRWAVDSGSRLDRMNYTHSRQEPANASSDGRKVCRSAVRSRRR
jgi:hypothetical protein